MIKRDELLIARSQAYSMENMEAHEAAGRDVAYIGSLVEGSRIYDYYKDEAGAYWYKNRIYLPDGTTATEEDYVFNRRRRRRA